MGKQGVQMDQFRMNIYSTLFKLTLVMIWSWSVLAAGDKYNGGTHQVENMDKVDSGKIQQTAYEDLDKSKIEEGVEKNESTPRRLPSSDESLETPKEWRYSE